MPVKPAIACLDVAYGEAAAAAAAALIPRWQAENASRVVVRRVEGAQADYKPGAFYARELPLLLSTIADIEVPVGVIVIDGYVWLGAHGEPGLGARLFADLGGWIPVIGIAKTRYRDDTWSVSVLRSASKRPLFVTAAGIEAEDAASHVRDMHGDHRIPTILALADRAARSALAGAE